MAVDVTIPELGESLFEATIGHWVKAVGEPVAAGEPLVEIETDKVMMEVTAPAAGVVASVRKREGETAAVGEVIATLETDGAAVAQASAPGSAATPPGSQSVSPEPPSKALVAATAPPMPPSSPALPPGGPDHHGAPPSVRRLARTYGVDLDKVAGTGPHGTVTREDVETFAHAPGPASPPKASAPAAPAAPAAPGGGSRTSAPAPASASLSEERVRMSRRRLTIARQLVSAKRETAMLTTFNEVDMHAIMDLRKERKERFESEHGVRLGFMSFFVTAVVRALRRFPRLNAEIQGDEMVLKRHYDIGIAVAAEEGLVVPVLREADRLGFADIERRIAEMAERARAGTLTLDDLRGGTFTITNGGVFGSLFSTPILNPPQVGILGMHTVQERPMAVNGEVIVRPMMYVALSYDHRIVDGSEAVRFLAAVKRMLEDPMNLLLEA